MNIEDFISKHAEWKIKFRNAITKKEKLDAETIAKDNVCDLGKWLYGEAKAKFGKLASYSEVVAKHAAFHTEASKVAKAINAGKYDEASAMIESGTPYARASSDVASALLKLKREAGL